MAEEEGKVIVEKGEVAPEQMVELETGEYMTVSEIADNLRYSYQWVLWMLQEGRIRGIKPLGGRWRIPKSEYNRILKEGIPPLPREQADKPPIKEIEVDRKVVERIKEPKKKEGGSFFPLDFTGLFGGKE